MLSRYWSVKVIRRELYRRASGIITNTEFGNARIVEVLPEPLLALLKKGIIPVVAGFQGRTPAGDITTRAGGSDTAAAALGAALDAETVEIFTDVDGIMTADPTWEAHTWLPDL